MLRVGEYLQLWMEYRRTNHSSVEPFFGYPQHNIRVSILGPQRIDAEDG